MGRVKSYNTRKGQGLILVRCCDIALHEGPFLGLHAASSRNDAVASSEALVSSWCRNFLEMSSSTIPT